MHVADLAHGGNLASADGPDRFIGYHQVFAGGAVRDGTRQLAANDVERVVSFALRQAFAHADHCDKTGIPSGRSFVAHVFIALIVVFAPLRVAEDHVRGPGVFQHVCRHITGVGAAGVGVTVLTADADWASDVLGTGNQCRRGADQDVSLLGCRESSERLKFRQSGRCAVHFPIACCQLTSHDVPLFCNDLLRKSCGGRRPRSRPSGQFWGTVSGNLVRQLIHVFEFYGLATATGVRHIWVVEFEAAFQKRDFVINFSAKEEHLRHRSNHHHGAVFFDHLVMRIAVSHVVHGVLHACAAALLHANPQTGVSFFVHELGDLFDRRWCHSHSLLSGNAKHRLSFLTS
mmetsp:Transcript_27092/g.49350  ORF Transcript_27092/g.49350 Transcript_27092/m.49350 type:complete len:345 (-) Transcript_27092:392-1426(-)